MLGHLLLLLVISTFSLNQPHVVVVFLGGVDIFWGCQNVINVQQYVGENDFDCTAFIATVTKVLFVEGAHCNTTAAATRR